ncbi:hypothetical protein [Aeromonas salmonicida]|uniref:hypothetical protein n=1 Tax=Aeromonas salmonicida TaxID=645 RepID=UPI0030CD1E2E
MTKEQEFLYIVQMTAIGNAINLSTQGESVCDEYRTTISGTGFFNLAHDAIRCSKQIPPEMDAIEAANDFITYFLENQRESEEDPQCPYWCLSR